MPGDDRPGGSLYVGFIETALSSLRPGGVLGFICADRWMRNQYGRPLRRLVSTGYAVETVLAMHDVDAFHDQVSAYPAVTVIRRRRQGAAVVAQARREFDADQAGEFATWARKSTTGATKGRGFVAARLPRWFDGDAPWPSASPARLKLIEQLNERYVALGAPGSGVRVGIGVATGADRVFISTDPHLVEPDRLLPLAMAGDTREGELRWSGHYLVNPWDESGGLVSLDRFPRLARHLWRYMDDLRNRHVGRR